MLFSTLVVETGLYAIFITSLRAHSYGPRGRLEPAGTVLVTPALVYVDTIKISLCVVLIIVEY